MRTTCIMNMKGGTAKTVTVANAAAILSKDYGKRVLLIDADSQGNLSEFMAEDPGCLDSAKGTADLLKGFAPMGLVQTKISAADLLPGNEDLMTLDVAAMMGGQLDGDALRNWLQTVGGSYDHCLIDCPPAFNAAAMAALRAADDVIIPVKLDAFGIRGLSKIMAQIRNMRTVNPKLKIAGVLPTMFYNSADQRQAEADLREVLRSVNVKVFPHIRRSPKVDESTFEQMPLVYFSPISGACRDYRKFVSEYLLGEVK